MKNKVTTCGYFLKRLRDCGYTANRIFTDYNKADPRRWTIMVDPNNAALYITCYLNKDWYGDLIFELHNGNQFKNLQLKTDSMEVIITKLLDKDIPPTRGTI